MEIKLYYNGNKVLKEVKPKESILGKDPFGTKNYRNTILWLNLFTPFFLLIPYLATQVKPLQFLMGFQ